MEIPYKELSPKALSGVIESFVLREGTDYGENEFSLEEKVAQVVQQLERGEIRLYFDPEAETCNLLTPQELRRLQEESSQIDDSQIPPDDDSQIPPDDPDEWPHDER